MRISPHHCPEEVAKVLLEILYVATLNIRAAAFRGDAERCHSEADHVHNLPLLLQGYWPDELDYYWKCQRANFIRQSRGIGLEVFEPLWNQLAPFVK